MPRREVTQTFGASPPTIKRYLTLRCETGDVKPKPIPGPPAPKRALARAGKAVSSADSSSWTNAEHTFETVPGPLDGEMPGMID